MARKEALEDPNLYVIQAGISIPSIQQPNRQPRCPETLRLLKLDIGESFMVPLSRRGHARSRMHYVSALTGAKFSGRTTAQGFRIWRVEHYDEARERRYAKARGHAK